MCETYTDQLPLAHPQLGTFPAASLSMCSDLGLKQQPFSFQAGAQSSSHTSQGDIVYLIYATSMGGWLSWLECGPIHQNVAGLTPGQGTYLGCSLNPGLWCIQEAIN